LVEGAGVEPAWPR